MSPFGSKDPECGVHDKEETMSEESFLDQMKAFGARLGLPKVDVDKLIDVQLKNIDAMAQSAHVVGEGQV